MARSGYRHLHKAYARRVGGFLSIDADLRTAIQDGKIVGHPLEYKRKPLKGEPIIHSRKERIAYLSGKKSLNQYEKTELASWLALEAHLRCRRGDEDQDRHQAS